MRIGIPLFVVTLFVTSGVRGQTPLPPGFVDERIYRGLEEAATMAVAPDGRFFIAERIAGRIAVVSNGRLEEAPYFVFTDVLSRVDGAESRHGFQDFHGGLIALAFDPDFTTNGHVYAYYTTKVDGGKNRIVRLTGQDAGSSMEILLDNIPRGITHMTGRLLFGTDGKLLASIGDLDVPEEAQNPGSAGGKILRMNTDGTAPEDNPFVGMPGYRPTIFAYGIRNAFGLAVDPMSGKLYESENGIGPTDEFNFIPKGANLGHPDCHGRCGGGLKDAIYVWPIEIAPTGVVWYDGDAFPPRFQGSLFVGSFLRGAIYRMELTEDGKKIENVSLFLDKGRGAVYDVQVGRDGFLYYLYSDVLAEGADELRRIRPLSTTLRPALSYTGNSRPGRTVSLAVTGEPGATVELLHSYSWAATDGGEIAMGEPTPLGEIGPHGALVVPMTIPLNTSGLVQRLQAIVTGESGTELTRVLTEPIY